MRLSRTIGKSRTRWPGIVRHRYACIELRHSLDLSGFFKVYQSGANFRGRAAHRVMPKKTVPRFGGPKRGTDRTYATTARKVQLLWVDHLHQHGGRAGVVVGTGHIHGGDVVARNR